MQSLRASSCTLPGQHLGHLPRAMVRSSRPARKAPIKAEGGDGDPPPSSKTLETMRKFSTQYTKRTGTYFCSDKSVTAVVIQGLAEKKDKLGAPLCPCRHYDDEQAEANQGFWNCPCVPMRERKECHCMLFLTEDNDFSGDSQDITIEVYSFHRSRSLPAMWY